MVQVFPVVMPALTAGHVTHGGMPDMAIAQPEAAVRHDLIERMNEARRRSDALFAVVHAHALYDRPIPERHRIVFYIGHLEAFDWNLLHGVLPGLKSFHPDFGRLFAFGIDPVNGGLPDDQPSDWPALERVRDYLTGIRSALDAKLDHEGSFDRTRDGFSLDTLLNVAIEHRLMHVETLAYMLHQLPLDRKVRHETSADSVTAPVAHKMIDIPSGAVMLGLRRDSGSFGWDNEFEAHEADVPAFAIDQYKVTNRQYLEFVNAGGYEARELWSNDDWKWKSEQGISHPIFWKRAGETWQFRGMFDEGPLPPDWPVYVSHAEAGAFARWVGKSLPTEGEWQRAAHGAGQNGGGHGAQRLHYSPAIELAEPGVGNFDFARWNPAPVNAHPRGQSAFGVQDLLGNGWE
ncbi:MAG: SUMF1/EgtB/PvdO family nonheme iron enzyme, partial [Terriglobales bacterium]